MERGRDLVIGFLDGAGHGAKPDLYILELDSGKIISDKLVWKEGRLHAKGVPYEAGTLLARFGASSQRLSILAEDTERTFEAPRMGSVRLHMAALPDLGEGQIYLTVREDGNTAPLGPRQYIMFEPDGVLRKSQSITPTATGPLEIKARLEVGTYQAAVEWAEAGSEELQTLHSRTIVVREGLETLIEWSPGR